ncbi:MAG: BON domain-containing protein, partial [Pseudohongiellaceae bacterium]
MIMIRIGIILGLLLALSACATVISSVSEEGIQEDPGRRTFGSMIEDGSIETKIRVNLNSADEGLRQAHISVQSYNGTVLLVGQVASQELKNLATRVARSSSNEIKTVHNELEVSGVTSFLSRSNDAWISTKLKSLMLANREISGLRTKVITE